MSRKTDVDALRSTIDIEELRKLRAELRDLKMAHKDSENMRHNLHTETKELKDSLKLYKRRDLSMLQSLLQERIDLVARVFRIDQRIELLGYDVDTVMKWAAKIQDQERR